MKYGLWLALLVLLLTVSGGLTSPTEVFRPRVIGDKEKMKYPGGEPSVNVPVYGAVYFWVPCKGNERTNVIASVNGSVRVAVYVYDANGNCVARDEALGARSDDDLSVEWFPCVPGTYSVQVCNMGMQNNEVALVIQ